MRARGSLALDTDTDDDDDGGEWHLVLQLFLSSPKATVRFGAVRTLNKIAMTHPLCVTTCNLDMENLITDVNRSIATLAITTLLKVRCHSCDYGRLSVILTRNAWTIYVRLEAKAVSTD